MSEPSGRTGEHLRAIGQVLGAINRSGGDIALVYSAVLDAAQHLLRADSAALHRAVEGGMEVVAISADNAVPGLMVGDRVGIDLETVVGRATLDRRTVHAPDTSLDPSLPQLGPRTRLAVPILSGDETLGVIVVAHIQPRPFTPDQIVLLETFAQQMAIAIENVRLFNETKEALERQTALAEILRAIAASPSELEPVFAAIASSARRFCQAEDASLIVRLPGDVLHVVSHDGPLGEVADWSTVDWPLDRASVSGRAIVDQQVVHVHDLLAEDAEFPVGKAQTQMTGNTHRTTLAAPLVRGGHVLGAILLRRDEVRPFSDRQVELLKAFADQAVIAIENVRLFNETKEALEQQTAVSDVLATISRSAFDLPPVLQTIVERAARLASADSAVIFRANGSDLVAVASYASPGIPALPLGTIRSADDSTLAGRALGTLRSHYVEDVRLEPVLPQSGPRTRFAVPIHRDGDALGVLVVTNVDVVPFTERQRALLETFADQAAIAMENVRLFSETKEALEQQTAVAEVLAAIGRSAFDLKTVLNTIVERAAALCGAESATIGRVDGDKIRWVALHGPAPVAAPDDATSGGYARLDGTTLAALSIRTREPQYVEDVRTRPELPQEGARTRLAVPLVRDGVALGTLMVFHQDVHPFTEREKRLVQTFADQAAIAIENVRLFNETKEALERQTATSEILQVISRSPTEIQPVLNAVAENAARLLGARDVLILRRTGDVVTVAAHVGDVPVVHHVQRLDPGMVSHRAITQMGAVHVPDLLAAIDEFPAAAELARQTGQRTSLAVPLIREDEAIGSILIRRTELRPFTDTEIDLLRTFAGQAVIAIENVRLFNETKEALERQTAVSEILRVMAGSPTDVAPVLQAIAESAARFCGAENVSVILEGEDGLLHPLGHVGGLATAVPPFPVDRTTVTGRSMVEGGPVHVHDLQAEAEDFPLGSAQARAMGHRTTLATPLVRAGRAFGAILLRRGEVRPFTEKQVELVRTFADQAVIAIDNVRLFNETKEALERQTAVSDILKVISASPTDIQPVLDAIASSAARFTGAEDASVLLVRDDIAETRAHHGPITNPASVPLDRGSVTGAAIVDGRLVHIRDVTEGDDYPVSKALSLANDEQRTVLAAPLMRDGRAMGAVVLRRREPRSFSERQVDLVRVFADQAVIAMENVRLFNETKESLEQQTAIADVLKVISRSAFDLQPVLETVTERATRLSGAMQGVMYRVDGDVLRYAAGFGPSQALMELNRRNPIHIGDRGTLSGRVTSDKRTVHIPDVLADPDYTYREAQELGGFRAMLGVPLVREGNVIGVMSLWRTEPAPFGDREIAIVETFADQAAIAIENVRLFNETKEALDQQTATSEVLQSISRSAFDLQGVLDTVVERAAQLCGAEQAWMRRIEGDEFRFAAYYGSSAELRELFDELRRDGAVAKIDHRGLGGRAVLEKRPIHVHDIVADEGLREASLARRGGGRTALAVPMLRDGEPIGAIVVARNRVAPFNDREIRLVETFADQAVIAIENVRLFHEIQEQSRRLEIAGKHKSEFLANMSHELRTPLNAIIGFSEVLLQGMFGELNEKQREYQQDVLSSGRHLLSLINDILDLAKIEAGRVELELSEFSLPTALENGVTMIRERAARHGIRVDLDVDGVDRILADERKVKQIVFNLLSNAVKFTGDGGHVGVRASRQDGEIQVSVRDTGIGIDDTDRDRIFQEFQQAGRDPERSREGTGLGLALTKRYVELHGGRIWVESQVGRGSTFTFALPAVPPGREG